MRVLLVLGILVYQSACSTAKVRVMPGEKENRVVVTDIEKDGAEGAAVKAATKYCEEKKQTAYFIEDKSEYTGEMEEGTRNAIRKGSKVAMILGSAGTTRKSSRGAGAVLGTAGTVGYGVTNDRDYKAEVRFRCK